MRVQLSPTASCLLAGVGFFIFFILSVEADAGLELKSRFDSYTHLRRKGLGKPMRRDCLSFRDGY